MSDQDIIRQHWRAVITDAPPEVHVKAIETVVNEEADDGMILHSIAHTAYVLNKRVTRETIIVFRDPSQIIP